MAVVGGVQITYPYVFVYEDADTGWTVEADTDPDVFVGKDGRRPKGGREPERSWWVTSFAAGGGPEIVDSLVKQGYRITAARKRSWWHLELADLNAPEIEDPSSRLKLKEIKDVLQPRWMRWAQRNIEKQKRERGKLPD
jgi:hypothetical protein